jgi:hypothetical protein
VSAEAAARAAQAQTLRRIGRGGLHEDSGEGGAAAALDASGRRDAAVAETQVIHHPSEAERVLRLLLQQLQRHMGRCAHGNPPPPSATACLEALGKGRASIGVFVFSRNACLQLCMHLKPPLPPPRARSHPELVAAGQAHVERLEGQRRLFLAARALALAQRMLL